MLNHSNFKDRNTDLLFNSFHLTEMWQFCQEKILLPTKHRYFLDYTCPSVGYESVSDTDTLYIELCHFFKLLSVWMCQCLCRTWCACMCLCFVEFDWWMFLDLFFILFIGVNIQFAPWIFLGNPVCRFVGVGFIFKCISHCSLGSKCISNTANIICDCSPCEYQQRDTYLINIL